MSNMNPEASGSLQHLTRYLKAYHLFSSAPLAEQCGERETKGQRYGRQDQHVAAVGVGRLCGLWKLWGVESVGKTY